MWSCGWLTERRLIRADRCDPDTRTPQTEIRFYSYVDLLSGIGGGGFFERGGGGGGGSRRAETPDRLVNGTAALWMRREDVDLS